MAIRGESILSQKSKVRWLKEGDLNTKFLHFMVNWRRKKNALGGLFIDDDRHKLDKVQFKKISYSQNHKLIFEFEEEEIKQVVWDCGSSKSPRSNGFNFKFLKAFWDIMKGDIFHFVKEFHTNGKLPRGTNTTFIKLLQVPFTYLGFPIGALSMVGRVCLINSVLGFLPLFYLSFFKMPKLVSNQIKSMQRIFLRGCKENQQKISWISWDKVTRPKG
uniref:Uncharacterized protein n=1 Tax=Cajanus cajan TaxID=3821 RepID=A0A151UDA1_CAJCA